MKDVKVILKTVSLLDNSPAETYSYNGRLDFKNGAHYLMYEEAEPAVKTIVKVSENEAVISRSGEMKSTLRVIKNGKSDTVYQTPYGPIYMTVCGIEVENNLENGLLLLEYRLENNGVIAHNRIEITLKEV